MKSPEEPRGLARKRYSMAPRKSKDTKKVKSPVVSPGKTPIDVKPHPGSENLMPAWKPGQSGNPSGRPKEVMGPAYRKALNRLIPNDKDGRTYAEAIAEKGLAMMLKGDIRVISEITDRVDGKAQQSVVVGGDGGLPIELSQMSPEDKRKRVAEIMAKARGTSD